LIKVLQVTGALNMGGAETMLMNVYREINRDKIQFDFIVSGKEIGFYESEAINLGASIYHIRKRSESFIGNLKDFYKIIKSNNYKVVHFHTQNAFFTTTQIIVARFAGGKRIIVHSHNTSDWRKGIARKMHFLCRPLLSALTDKKLSCGKAAAEWLYGSSRETKIIPLPVVCKKYLYSDEKYDILRKKYGYTDSIIYTHIGRFLDVKNHDFLIDVFYKIHSVEPKSVLFLIGNGPLRNDIEKKIKELELSDSVVLWGNISDVNEKLIMSDAFLFPSKYEGFPTVVLEAQAAGVSCFISDTITKDIAITELVHYLPLDEGVDLWVETILSRKSRNERERKMANRMIAEKYDVMQVAECFEKIYLA